MADKSYEKEKLTPFQKELIETYNKILEFKLSCEANIVSIIYKKPDILYENVIKLEDISNNAWKVYFAIANDIIINEKKNILDDITIGLYLEKHDKLKNKYIEYGGYDTIKEASFYTKEENFDGYLQELHKWNAVAKLAKHGFPVKERLSDYCDMTLEQIYNEYEAVLNDIIINADDDSKSYDISDGLDELIDELDKGLAVGLPYYGLEMLSKETGGQYLGSITLVGGISNVGKTTFARTAVIPSIIANNEKIVCMLNEDGLKKWQRELLVYVANNILKDELQKYVVRDGNFSQHTYDLLKQSAEWIKNNTQNHKIIIKPFSQYRTDKAIKTIKKYSSMGVKYFLLDTFKLDAGKTNSDYWIDMQQKMVDINDVIKPESRNLHILITFQLNKGSSKQRYYTQDNIGVAKNIIDTASTCIMVRDVFDDEKLGGNKELKVYRLDGINKRTKIPVKLETDKRYQLLFIIKNREGSANQFQIVIEHDMSRNIVKEIGITNVPIDF